MINAIQDYIEKKIFSISQNLDSGNSKAELANLRRGIGKKPGEIPQLWGSFLLELPEKLMSKTGEPSKAEWAVYIALTMYAMHQQGNSESVHKSGYEYSLGRSVKKLVKSEDDEARIRRRFEVMALSGDMAELSHHLRCIIQLLKTDNSIKLDYADLAKDIYLFQFEDKADRVRLKWGQDYFRIVNNEEKTERIIDHEQ